VVEEAVDAEVEQLSASPITRQELNMALRRARAQFIMAGESITGQAHLLGMAEATAGDYHWYESTIEKLNKITLDDLERVSQTYLTKENRTVGWYYPE
jgi:zinc protease